MAKQKASQPKPPITVETVKEEPLKTTETVEIKEDDASTLPPDSELTHIINDDTGELREVVTRAGYAPAPMPFGFRLATSDEVKEQGSDNL